MMRRRHYVSCVAMQIEMPMQYMQRHCWVVMCCIVGHHSSPIKQIVHPAGMDV